MEFLRGMLEFFTVSLPSLIHDPAPEGFWLTLGKATSFAVCVFFIGVIVAYIAVPRDR